MFQEKSRHRISAKKTIGFPQELGLRDETCGTTPENSRSPKLAERGGMSRSTFALRFKEMVGESPMEYLTRWRMLLAGDRLANSSDPISVIAPSLGLRIRKRVQSCLQKWSWAVRHDNIAVAAIRVLIYRATGKPPLRMGWNLSQCDLRSAKGDKDPAPRGRRLLLREVLAWDAEEPTPVRSPALNHVRADASFFRRSCRRRRSDWRR
jgi:AraC-like DNA-binding protein